MSLNYPAATQALRERRVFKGKVIIEEPEELYSLTVRNFFDLWKHDAVLAVAFYSATLDDFPGTQIECHLRYERLCASEIDDAFVSFLECWSNLPCVIRDDEVWYVPLREARALALFNPGGWCVLPKIRKWVKEYLAGGGRVPSALLHYQPTLFETENLLNIVESK